MAKYRAGDIVRNTQDTGMHYLILGVGTRQYELLESYDLLVLGAGRKANLTTDFIDEWYEKVA